VIRLGLSILVLLCISSPASSEWGPWKAADNRQSNTGTDAGIDPLQQMVRTFQKFVSPVDGPRCRMYPTCSGYSRQALREHGSFTGMMMTVDRLYRESDPLEQQDIILKWEHKRYFDPLEKNTFWWHLHGTGTGKK